MKLLSLLICAAITSFVIAQNPSFKNVEVFGSGFDDEGYEIKIVENRNYLVCGSFTDTLSVFDNTLISKGNNDAFFAKFDSLGNVLWINSIGGTTGDLATSIDMDSEGNYYFLGTFHSPVLYAFDTTVLSCGCAEYSFILKLSPLGELIWIKGLMGDGAFIAKDLKINENDEVIIGGSYYNSAFMYFGTYYSNGINDIILAAFSKNGEELFVKTYGNSGMESINSLEIDENNNIFITGWFNTNIDFGNGQMNSVGLKDIFTAKLDEIGNIIWSNSSGSAQNDEPNTINIDYNGNIIISGYYSGVIEFGSTMLESQGFEDVFIVKYNNLGDFVWIKTYGNSFDEAGISSGLDSDGNIYLTGRYMMDFIFGDTIVGGNTYSNAFVLKLDENGNENWIKTINGNRNDAGIGLFVLENNKLLVTGYIRDSAYFDNELFFATGQNDIFVAELSLDILQDVDNRFVADIQIFPIPASDYLHIVSNIAIAEFKIFDSTGKLFKVLNTINNSSYTLNINDLNAGIYFLSIITVDGKLIKSKKIVINK
ncbi:MAG: T9SS type A sorting domain-containing protein [Bacteroidales bacterium]|nr:T9SS type A sorting domain-containing protein [Bacteroidales bacterium]